MPKRRILGILCTGAAAFGLMVSAQSAEPAFKHKTLSRWLKLYQNAEPGSVQETQSVAAVRSMGTNAVPRLVQMLTTRNINVQQSAVTGFEILGELGAPAVPALTNLLYGTNPVENILAANSLGHIGPPALAVLMDALTNHSYNLATLAALSLPEMGTNALPAVPVFLHDLSSRNHFVRERATDALGNLHLEPGIVVPALTNLLNDSSLAARCMALNSLGQFKEAGSLAIPLIIPLLQDPEETVRVSATNALCDIAPSEYKRPARPALVN